MARARNIKPSLFKNEILGVADPLYCLLFEGLWVLADRAGKLEDRPMRIKAEIFPYRDGLDTDAMLDWLASNDFIVRYTVAGKRYILVKEFVKHQNPHKNEIASEIPDPEDIGTKPEEIGSSTEDVRSARADSLSTDSLNPIPDSLNSVPKGTGGKPPKLTDPKEIIFGYGLALLVNAGTPEKQARSFLGGLEKHHGADAVIDKLRDCAKAKPLQPLEWLAAALPPNGRKDVGNTTTPTPPSAFDALKKIKEDDAKTKPPSPETLARMAELRKPKEIHA
jgi:hypothetical protein